MCLEKKIDMNKPYYSDPLVDIYCADAFDILNCMNAQSVQSVVTSPPYWGLRLYEGTNSRDWNDHDAESWQGLLGSEPIHDCLGWAKNTRCNTCYVCHMMLFLDGIWRVLRDDGTVWINLGDTYTTTRNTHQKEMRETKLKPTNLVGIPWRVALAAQANGWYLRSDIIWSKTNPMPESVDNRPTKSHEYIFLLAKNPEYYFDAESIKEEGVYAEGTIGDYSTRTAIARAAARNEEISGNEARRLVLNNGKRNKRSVWEVPTYTYSQAHFATFPEKLVEPCIRSGTTEKAVVLDPFAGSGTTGSVAKRLNRKSILIEMSQIYIDLIVKRISETQPALF